MEPRVHTEKVIDIKARGLQAARGNKLQVADVFLSLSSNPVLSGHLVTPELNFELQMAQQTNAFFLWKCFS